MSKQSYVALGYNDRSSAAAIEVDHPRDLPEGSQVSEADYWQYYYEDTEYEWNNGYLEVKPVSDYATWQVYTWVDKLLQHYLVTNPIAYVVGLEFGFRLPLCTGVVIRKPDLCVVLCSNPIVLQPSDRSYKGRCDICIEALSDSTRDERDRDLIQKKAEYAAGGVQEYFILHDKAKYCRFYRLNHTGRYSIIKARDGVVYSQVLPGFCLRLVDLQTRPKLEALRHDPLYQSFVTPGWHQAEQQAQAELLLRQQAEQQAQAELLLRQQAEQQAQAELLLRQQAEQQAQAELLLRQQAEQQAQAELLLRQQAEQQNKLLIARLQALGINP